MDEERTSNQMYDMLVYSDQAVRGSSPLPGATQCKVSSARRLTHRCNGWGLEGYWGRAVL